MKFQYHDGGRAAAGFKGKAGDCVTRAVAIATGIPYTEVYNAIDDLGQTERITRGRRKQGRSSARTGVYKPTRKKYLDSLGWTWVPTMLVGQGCKVHLRAGELPTHLGTLIVAVSKHLTVVKDGVILDTHDPSRDGTRCVYGYYFKKVVDKVGSIR